MKDAYGVYRGLRYGDWSDLRRYVPNSLLDSLAARARERAFNEYEDRTLLYDDELYSVCNKDGRDGR